MMNFFPNSTNCFSANQQQSNVSGFNNGNLIPNNIPTYTGYPLQFPNSYQLQQCYYPQAQSGYNNFNNSNYTRTSETPVSVPKRIAQPLLVFDPHKNEAVDLVKASKTLTSHPNQSSKVSVSLNTIVGSEYPKAQLTDHQTRDKIKHDINDRIGNQVVDKEVEEVSDEEENDEDDEDEGEYVSEKQQDGEIDTQDDVESKTSEDLQSNTESSISNSDNDQTIKYSQSIPNKIECLSSSIGGNKITEISSSENNINHKLSSTNVVSTNEDDNVRITYDRATLLRLSESPLCRKPALDCNEIVEIQNVKARNIRFLPDNSNNSLQRTKHGYLPPYLRLKEQCSTNSNLKTCRRNFKSILNRIAPQNFKICFEEIKSLITATDVKDIDIKECMDCLIEEIFDKAVQEEAYSVTYADLCTQIVKYDDSHKMDWTFKLRLVDRCKNMFQTPLQDQLKSVREHWVKKIGEEKEEKLKILYQSDIEEQVKKAHDKYFGNIRFIGELYLHDLLLPKIINMCANTLISKPQEEDAMLSLCKLFETCGKKFDEKHNDKMQEHINKMIEISNIEDLHKRIRFRLFDIIEMSKRKWTLRSVQAQKIIQPKTLDQVKKDDLDDKVLEASKLANQTQIRLSKRSNANYGEIKFKPQQSKMQSLDINSLKTPSDNDIQLKPSYGQWTSGSAIKDDEWQNNKRPIKYSNKYTRQQQKATSPIISRDESPTKYEIGGRFALLQQEDLDNASDSIRNSPIVREPTPDLSEQLCNDNMSLSSTREQSPSNSEFNNLELLDSDGIFDKLLDIGFLDVNSWCQLSNVSQTIASWLDRIMEKNSLIRNMVGDELAKLIANGKLSMDVFKEGLKVFSLEINDLKTDIPLIWDFLAEFLERFIVNSHSDISFFNMITDSTTTNNEAAHCVALCLKSAAARLGPSVIKQLMTNGSWSLATIVVDEQHFLRSHELDFLSADSEMEYFFKYRDELIALLPNDDEVINEFLADKFGATMSQTVKCAYFVSRCVFAYVSHLTVEDVTAFFFKQKLFFFRLLDRRSEFEKQTLDALTDSIGLFRKKDLLTAVINGLSNNNILTNDAFQQYIQRDECIDGADNTNRTMIADLIRSMLENRRR